MIVGKCQQLAFSSAIQINGKFCSRLLIFFIFFFNFQQKLIMPIHIVAFLTSFVMKYVQIKRLAAYMLWHMGQQLHSTLTLLKLNSAIINLTFLCFQFFEDKGNCRQKRGEGGEWEGLSQLRPIYNRAITNCHSQSEGVLVLL